MRFGRIWTMRGPSIWSREPVIEAEFDHEGDVGVPPDLLKTSPATFAHLLLDLTRSFQKATDFVGHIAGVHETRRPGYVRIVFDYDEEILAKACLDAALECTHLAPRDGIISRSEMSTLVAKLRHLAHETRLGPSTAGIVAAARARGIPYRRLTSGSLVQLGWSKNLRRIWTAETDQTPIIAETIAQDKDLTRQLLYEVGVPVPWGRPVVDANDAWVAAEELGLPVVVKPRFGNQGRGVAANLSTKDQVLAAYESARQESSFVMVENYLPGRDHRLLVVGGKLTAASLREPAHVIGDGVSSISSLISEINKDPRRSDGHATPLSFIKIDAIARAVLEEQSLTPESIPVNGERVWIRRNANLSTGGTAADVTDLVHPENALAAIDAARAVGLDVAGVDFVIEDISKPWKEQGGGIVEVNAGPGLRMHLEPSSGKPRDVGAAILESLFPSNVNGERGAPAPRGTESLAIADGHSHDTPPRGAYAPRSPAPGRIPVVAVTGVNGKTTTSRLIAHLLRSAGLSVGLTCTDGIYLNGRRTETRDCSGPQSARAIFLNPQVDAAVLETARGGILREGLGFDLCDVAIVTNIGKGDHFGLRGIETLDELARVKRVVVEAVSPTGAAVLNAADPLVAAMAAHCPGEVIFFARSEHEPALNAHLAGGGAGVFVRDGQIVFVRDRNEESLFPLSESPLLRRGVPFQIENALAAVAAAWRLTVGASLLACPTQPGRANKLAPTSAIRSGLRTFEGNADECPARFNVIDAGNATVIVDYAHNPSAIAALIAGLDAFPHPRRIIVTSGSNRRDSDLVDMGTMMGDAFDRVVLYADFGHSGRDDGELNMFLKQGLASGSRAKDVVDVPSERQAIADALDALKPGDLLVVGVESIEESLRLIRERLSWGQAY